MWKAGEGGGSWTTARWLANRQLPQTFACNEKVDLTRGATFHRQITDHRPEPREIRLDFSPLISQRRATTTLQAAHKFAPAARVHPLASSSIRPSEG